VKRIYAYGIGAIALAALWLAVKEPPTSLTEQQRQDVVARLGTEILVGQLRYDLPQIMPPPVQFTLTNGNAAESECSHARLKEGHPDWTLRVNERLAAAHWEPFISETIPHEAAHLILCQTSQDWAAHGDRWKSVVREMGATPAEYHRYE
jgi:hypothetical protein